MVLNLEAVTGEEQHLRIEKDIPMFEKLDIKSNPELWKHGVSSMVSSVLQHGQVPKPVL